MIICLHIKLLYRNLLLKTTVTLFRALTAINKPARPLECARIAPVALLAAPAPASPIKRYNTVLQLILNRDQHIPALIPVLLNLSQLILDRRTPRELDREDKEAV